MEALLLAGGLGTRLKSLTQLLPKCLMPISGVPLLCIWLRQLQLLGFSRVYINLHYLGSYVKQVVEESGYSDFVIYIHEPVLLGTGGTVVKLIDTHKIRSPLFVCHADNFSTGRLELFKESFERSEHCKRGAALVSFTTDTPKDCGIVQWDTANTLISFEERPLNPLSSQANGAIYIFSENILKKFKKTRITDISTEGVPMLVGKSYCWQTDGALLDIGVLSRLREAQSYDGYVESLRVESKIPNGLIANYRTVESILAWEG